MRIDEMKKLFVEFICDESGQAGTEFRNALALAALCAALIISLSYAVHNGQMSSMSSSVRTQLRTLASTGQVY
jgi:Flp pilus assembly pilin Flp